MSETDRQYWNAALERYKTKEWVDKPTIFVEQIKEYLPESGALLELAAGQGQDSRYFARQGYDVTATDLVDVYSHLGLHYLDKTGTEKMMREIHRVLKRGGVLAGLLNSLDDQEIQTSAFVKIDEDYYNEVAFDFKKRFFSAESAQAMLGDLFEPILVDNAGETYKDEIKTLVRLVARKK